MKKLELENQRFGRLVVIQQDYSKNNGRSNWLVQCDCGSEPLIVDGYSLTSGRCKSCGCIKKEINTRRHEESQYNQMQKNNIKAIQEELKRNEIVGNVYGFLKVDAYVYSKNKHRYYTCTCLNCGGQVVVRRSNLTSYHTISCGCVKSKGEEKISKILNKNGISFVRQYTHKNCVYKHLLSFDFAIFKNNHLICLIEYDGKQHFEPIEFFGGEEGFKEQQIRDEVKNNFCKNNNIPLIRIKESEIDNILQYINEYYNI